MNSHYLAISLSPHNLLTQYHTSVFFLVTQVQLNELRCHPNRQVQNCCILQLVLPLAAEQCER